MNSFTSSVFPSEANGETEKKLFLSSGRFHSLLVAFRNSKTRRHSEIKQSRSSTDEARFFRRSIVKNTEASLASLHATRPGRRPSGPPYLHSVYDIPVGPNAPKLGPTLQAMFYQVSDEARINDLTRVMLASQI